MYNIRKKDMIQSWENFVTDGWKDRQTDRWTDGSDFMRGCLTSSVQKSVSTKVIKIISKLPLKPKKMFEINQKLKKFTYDKVLKLMFLLLSAEQFTMMHDHNCLHNMLTPSKYHSPYCAGNPREQPVPWNKLDCHCYYIPWRVNTFVDF